MRLLIHDYCGHPFQFDLSQELAKRGHQVIHVYTQASGGPKAGFGINKKNLEVKNIVIKVIQKRNFMYRWMQESSYGNLVTDFMEQWKPEVIISANTPLAAQRKMVNWANRNRIPFVFWLQDIISVAAKSIFKKRLGILGNLVGFVFHRIEKKALLSSKHVVAITNDFKDIVQDWGIEPKRVSVIPNWAPIEKIQVLNKSNPFSKKHGLDEKFVVLYSGTLGMKHNPELIVRASKAFKEDQDILFVVVSGEFGMAYLVKSKKKWSLNNLLLLPFQPFDLLPQVLASADVLLVILEPSAGVFSVPSKVWSGFCAGRPTVMVVPEHNQAARVTREIEAGFIVRENNMNELISKIKLLKSNKRLCKKMGSKARSYAEKHFPVDKIADKFEKLFESI